jgi:hypothetical protein
MASVTTVRQRARDDDGVVDHLQVLLFQLNYRTKECAACHWVDHESKFSELCVHCGKDWATTFCGECITDARKKQPGATHFSCGQCQ